MFPFKKNLNCAPASAFTEGTSVRDVISEREGERRRGGEGERARVRAMAEGAFPCRHDLEAANVGPNEWGYVIVVKGHIEPGEVRPTFSEVAEQYRPGGLDVGRSQSHVHASPPASTKMPTTYVVDVQKGDTLGKIAKQRDCTVGHLLDLNPDVDNRHVIFPGDLLLVPYVEALDGAWDDAEDKDDENGMAGRWALNATSMVSRGGLSSSLKRARGGQGAIRVPPLASLIAAAGGGLAALLIGMRARRVGTHQAQLRLRGLPSDASVSEVARLLAAAGRARGPRHPKFLGGDRELTRAFTLWFGLAGRQEDQQKAAKIIQRRARENVSFAVGFALFRGLGGDSPDPDRALHYLIPAANEGHPWAQYLMGEYHSKGYGNIPRDTDLAYRWWTRSLVNGNCDAGNFLGAWHRLQALSSEGNAAYRHHAKCTVLYWRYAAERHRVANACYNLGTCYEKGFGVKVDQGEAKKWFRRASAQGKTVLLSDDDSEGGSMGPSLDATTGDVGATLFVTSPGTKASVTKELNF